MSHLHTELPPNVVGRRGERELAERLMSLRDEKLHLWFGLDYLPGVGDIDVLALHEDVGIFVVEVKAVRLDSIESFSFMKCSIQGRKSDISPQRQAYRAYEGLRDFLGTSLLRRLGYVSCTACWPRIYRREWNHRIDNVRLRDEFAHRMIFLEDLTEGATVFSNRLRYIYGHPPHRGGARYGFVHKNANLQALENALKPEARLRPADSDLQRLRKIEQEVKVDALRDVPTDRQVRLVYRGYPGTGKTFRLLGIALQHALSGRRVLFACYNKVLGADLRRLMHFSKELRWATGEIEIRDVYDLLGEFARQYGIKDVKSDHDEWGELVADEIVETPEMRHYDTVLIDEAQDMEDWALRMLEHLGRSDATICIAVGRGQELYGARSRWLSAYWNTSQIKELRRNFRNTKPVFKLAQTFYETNLKQEHVTGFLAKFKGGAYSETEILFDREDGLPTMLYYINDAALDEYDAENDSFILVQRDGVVVSQYQRIIKEQLEEMSKLREQGSFDEYPMDLLILVPSKGGQERQWAVDALNALSEDVDYIDYTREENRRQIARRDAVRLCTFHSARGVEGTRVVAFGFENVQDLAKKTNTDLPNLGYVVLSRSMFEMLTVFRKSRNAWPVPKFVESVLKEMDAESRR